MDRIPIGGTPPEPEGEHPDNVVRLPSPQAPGVSAEPPVGEPVEEEAMPIEDGEEVSWEHAVAADAEADVAGDPDPPIPGAGVTSMLEQGLRVGAGMVSAGAAAVADALRTTMPPEDAEGTDPVATAAGAGLGAAITAAEAAASAAKSAAEAVGPLLSWAANPAGLKGVSETAASAARLLDGQWKATQAETGQVATAFLTSLIPEITTAILDQIDLTQIVRDRVDVNAIVEDVDMDRILERLDIDAIVNRVDVNAVVERVDMQHLVEELPIDSVVDRVDVNQIVERVDIRSVVDRLDLAEIIQEVMDEIDLPSIIRESSGAMASETVQTVRVRGMDADHLVSRIIDRMIRRDSRELDAPGEPKVD